ncbi:hypothetical protein N6H14_04560 [Paenibacillus sp. CC-CFT747]|nr:hypothetical protein N6H14_04560 [Paenibacillus sp. CC-CFT747]
MLFIIYGRVALASVSGLQLRGGRLRGRLGADPTGRWGAGWKPAGPAASFIRRC